MPKGPFVASQFVPTQWNTAEAKARFGNTYLHIVDADFQRSLFTKQLQPAEQLLFPYCSLCGGRLCGVVMST
jgi:hypothetical protein